MRWPDVRRALLAAAPALALLLAACSTPAPPPAATLPATLPAPAPAAASAAAEPATPFGDDLQRLRSLPGPELASECQALLASPVPRARLKGVIALALPQHPARDEARAVALADEMARAPDLPVALRDLAAAVALWLDEQRRAEANGRRAQTKAREDEARLAMTEARLREMEKRAADAEKKLEALRAIERDLSGRGSGNGRP
jgi:hypothetical protein